jgi:hypothetical protein
MFQNFLFFVKSITTVVIEDIIIIIIEVTAVIVNDNGLMLEVSDLDVIVMEYFAIRITCFDHMKVEVRNEITETNQLQGSDKKTFIAVMAATLNNLCYFLLQE